MTEEQLNLYLLKGKPHLRVLDLREGFRLICLVQFQAQYQCLTKGQLSVVGNTCPVNILSIDSSEVLV